MTPIENIIKEAREKFEIKGKESTLCKDCNTVGLGTWNHMKSCPTKNRPEHDFESFLRQKCREVWNEAINTSIKSLPNELINIEVINEKFKDNWRGCNEAIASSHINLEKLKIHNEKTVKCTCGEPHVTDRIIHRSNGQPCYIKNSMADPDSNDTVK